MSYSAGLINNSAFKGPTLPWSGVVCMRISSLPELAEVSIIAPDNLTAP